MSKKVSSLASSETIYAENEYSDRSDKSQSIKSTYEPNAYPSDCNFCTDSDLYATQGETSSSHSTKKIQKPVKKTWRNSTDKARNLHQSICKKRMFYNVDECIEEGYFFADLGKKSTEFSNQINNNEIPSDCHIPYLEMLIKLPISEENIAKLCFCEELIVAYCPNKESQDKEECNSFEPLPANNIGTMYIDVSYYNGTLFSYSESQIECNEGLAYYGLLAICDNRLKLIEEKKIETFIKCGERTEKSLQVVSDDFHFQTVTRLIEGNKIRTERNLLAISVTGDLVLEGALYILLRYLVVSKFRGIIETWAMTITGDLGYCVYEVQQGKFFQLFQHIQETILIKRTLYIQNQKPEISETYFKPTGELFRHMWKGNNYFIHFDTQPKCKCDVRRSTPSLKWDLERELFFIYLEYKQEKREELKTYLLKNSEFQKMLKDCSVLAVMMKPLDLRKFVTEYFNNLANY